MLSDKHVLMQIERYKDLHRELEHDALVQEASSGKGKRRPWLLRAIRWELDRINDLRCWLKRRFAAVETISINDPCYNF